MGDVDRLMAFLVLMVNIAAFVLQFLIWRQGCKNVTPPRKKRRR